MPVVDLFFGEEDPWVAANDPGADRPVWLRPRRPHSKVPLGGLPRIAAYIAAHVDIGQMITLRELAANVPDLENLEAGDSGPNGATQYQRRFRDLRAYGWVIDSSQDDPSLAVGVYRLRKLGEPLWIPNRARSHGRTVSPKVRNKIFERDGFRCVLCGYGVNETYEDGTKVKLRAARRVPETREGKATEDNLRTECARCNDAIRDERFNPVTLPELWPSVRRQSGADKSRLLQWLLAGQRSRNEIEVLYDRVRFLAPSERNELIRRLGGKPPSMVTEDDGRLF